MKLLNTTTQALKGQERKALAEFLASAARTAGVGSLTVVWALALGYCIGGKSRPGVALTGFLATASAIATVISSKDTENDWNDWQALNSSQTRQHWREASLEAELAEYNNTYRFERQALVNQPNAGTTGLATPHQEDVSEHPAREYSGLELAIPVKSSIIVGQPGAGKGLLVAAALRHVKAQQPDVSIWAVTVKDDPSELGRWAIADELHTNPLPAFTTGKGAKAWQRGVDEFLARFAAHSGPKLLVFDEALAVKEKTGSWFTGLMANLNHLASTGRSTRCYAWLLSQTPNAGDFGISGGARNVFRRVLLVSQEDTGLLLNRTTFTDEPPTGDALQALLRPTGRVMFDSLNGWGFLAKLGDYQPTPEQASRRLNLEASLGATDLLEYLAGKPDGLTTRKLYQNWGQRRYESTRALEGDLERWKAAGLLTHLNRVWRASDKLTGPD